MSFQTNATLVIINTCAFISDAAQESIEIVLQEAQDKAKTGRRIVVTGCLVERYREKLAGVITRGGSFCRERHVQ
ncbi:MAG: hypothetical protein MZV64_36190 [Ignavibacteriales bacterium]|nr:hypothetical protein [Ignavibacteriales bacterium]